MNIKIPQFLNEVLGENQTLVELFSVLFFSLFATIVLYYKFWEDFFQLNLLNALLVILLIFDICAGCIANFTHGTNVYYAKRRKHRIVFIVIHVHILILSWLIEGSVNKPAIVIWIYSIACSTLLNFLISKEFQKTIGACLFGAGLLLAFFITWNSDLVRAVSLLFMLKVIYAFSVDHYFDYESVL